MTGKPDTVPPSQYDPNQSEAMSATLEVDYRILYDAANSPPGSSSDPTIEDWTSSSSSDWTVPTIPTSPFQDPLVPPAPRSSGAGNGSFAPKVSWKWKEPKSDDNAWHEYNLRLYSICESASFLFELFLESIIKTQIRGAVHQNQCPKTNPVPFGDSYRVSFDATCSVYDAGRRILSNVLLPGTETLWINQLFIEQLNFSNWTSR